MAFDPPNPITRYLIVNHVGPGDSLARIQELEHSAAVDHWSAEGLMIWPIIRAALGYSSFSKQIVAKKATHVAEGSFFRYLRAAIRDGSNHAPIEARTDAIFLADGISKVSLHGRWYDRICEPFMDHLDRLQASYLCLEPGYRCHWPRNRPSRFIQPRLDLIRQLVRFQRHPSAGPPPGFEDLVDHANMLGFDPTLITWDTVVKQAHLVRAWAAYFEELLTRTDARVGFAVDMNLTTMGFHIACRRAGVRSIEIQHGSIGVDHWAYSGWTKVPRGGYDLLPTDYWVWSPSDARVIESWAKTTASHRSVVGGNLWLRKWEQLDQVTEPYDLAVRSRMHADRSHILWTMQPLLREESGVLIDAIRQSPRDWVWWCRVHPLMTEGEIDEMAKDLSAVGVTRTDIDWASTLPLPALLRRVEAHVTHSSSTVVDAAQFGVPSVITGREFAGLLPASQEVQVASTGSEVVEALRAVRAVRPVRSAQRSVDPITAIVELLRTPAA